MSTVDWKNYEPVLIPNIKDIHKIDVYRDNGGYSALKSVLTDIRSGLTKKVSLKR